MLTCRPGCRLVLWVGSGHQHLPCAAAWSLCPPGGDRDLLPLQRERCPWCPGAVWCAVPSGRNLHGAGAGDVHTLHFGSKPSTLGPDRADISESCQRCSAAGCWPVAVLGGCETAAEAPDSSVGVTARCRARCAGSCCWGGERVRNTVCGAEPGAACRPRDGAVPRGRGCREGCPARGRWARRRSVRVPRCQRVCVGCACPCAGSRVPSEPRAACRQGRGPVTVVALRGSGVTWTLGQHVEGPAAGPEGPKYLPGWEWLQSRLRGPSRQFRRSRNCHIFWAPFHVGREETRATGRCT